MHKRHLRNLAGKTDPGSGLQVRAYEKPFDFEWQVEQHMKLWRSELAARPHWSTDARAKEREIRRGLATGQAWLNTEPQMELFGE